MKLLAFVVAKCLFTVRFDFTDREPAAAKHAGRSSIKQTPTAVASATVQQQLESLQQEFAAKHLTHELEDAPEDAVTIEGIVLGCQKGELLVDEGQIKLDQSDRDRRGQFGFDVEAPLAQRYINTIC